MARSILSVLVQASRAATREAVRRERLAARGHPAAIRRAEQTRRAEELASNRAAKSAAAYQKELEKEARAAHVAARQAEVEELTSGLTTTYDEIDSLLAATLGVDDYVDLEGLRRTTEQPPFDRADLELPTPAPAVTPEPDEPVLILPTPPRPLFGRKKKHAKAVAAAETAHAQAHAAWELEVEAIRVRRQEEADQHAQKEQVRFATLEKERARFAAEVIEHNKRLDAFITNLGYGTVDAVEEYVSIVVANSTYPEHFKVDHSYTYDPATAELKIRVLIPPPGSVTTTKAYKYKKSSDEIAATQLSQKEIKDRYSNAVHQVAIRSFHEIFEADRRGLIKMISLEVGTEDSDPATGVFGFIPFVAATAKRDAFITFDLSGVVPAATLKHLGAAVSKDPYALVAADTTGIRRS